MNLISLIVIVHLILTRNSEALILICYGFIYQNTKEYTMKALISSLWLLFEMNNRLRSLFATLLLDRNDMLS